MWEKVKRVLKALAEFLGGCIIFLMFLDGALRTCIVRPGEPVDPMVIEMDRVPH